MKKYLLAGVAAIMLSACASDGDMKSEKGMETDKAKSEKLFRRLLSVEDGGRFVTFAGPEGGVVKAKISGSRTKILYGKRLKHLKDKKKSKMVDRSVLKKGYICTITYMPSKKNEPSDMKCANR